MFRAEGLETITSVTGSSSYYYIERSRRKEARFLYVCREIRNHLFGGTTVHCSCCRVDYTKRKVQLQSGSRIIAFIVPFQVIRPNPQISTVVML